VKRAKPEKIYQLKVSLKDARPPIWRCIQVRGDVTLAKLHRILQTTMGWHDGHLHQFILGRTYYGVPSEDAFFDMDTQDERKARLDQLLASPKQKMDYEYDFGDGWEHEILLEKILPPEPKVRYPRCIAGARACPPEDCGGVSGYEGFLQAIRDPNHEEHEDCLEWIGRAFDPEEFELEEVDAALRRLR
jgi:hypothetical protein